MLQDNLPSRPFNIAVQHTLDLLCLSLISSSQRMQKDTSVPVTPPNACRKTQVRLPGPYLQPLSPPLIFMGCA
jgi:hypothetical protein